MKRESEPGPSRRPTKKFVIFAFIGVVVIIVFIIIINFIEYIFFFRDLQLSTLRIMCNLGFNDCIEKAKFHFNNWIDNDIP